MRLGLGLGIGVAGAAPSLAVSPASPTVRALDEQQFSASGGSGGYTWSLTVNASGGSVTSTGLYVAGPDAGSDTVHVVDGHGIAGNTTITVTADKFTGALGTRYSQLGAIELGTYVE